MEESMRRALSGLAAVLVTSLAGLSSQMALAATTGLDFAGGCPSSESTNTGLCDQGANADVANVSAILGINESLVTQIGEISSFSGTGPGFSVDSADGGQSGTWSVSDSAITHIAFKADTYFILGKVTAGSGTWEMAPATWDLSLAMCPATICTVDPGLRPYAEVDFLNLGGQIADLSNVRAFSVVPVPAAVWMFGSGLLGLIGFARRRRAA
jgi:hypothetical protein